MKQTFSRALVAETAVLAWPAVLQGLLSTVIFFTDRLLLGRYSADAIGSMQISGPLMWSLFSVFGAFSAGMLAVIGRSVGAGDSTRASQTLKTMLYFAAIVGLFIAAAGFFLRVPIASILANGEQTTPVIRDLAITYMGVVFPAAPFSLVGTTCFTALQASGDTRSPMWISALCGSTNLLISAVLIYGLLGFPELGIVGAGLGTITAFVGQAAFGLYVLSKKRGPLIFNGTIKAATSHLWPVLKISGPAFGERMIFHTGFLVFTAFIGHLGNVAMAANQSLIAIESLGFIVANGFGIAGGALVAQKLGANKPEEAASCGWISAMLGGVCLVGVAMFFLLCRTWLVGLFSTDPEVIKLGVQCMVVAAIAQPLMAISDALAGSLRGAGDTKNPMWIALAGPLLVRLTASWYLAFHLELGLLGIWIGSTMDWFVRSTLLVWVFARGRWRDLVV